ncbi:MAG: PIG-L family deacetylase [Proteobacteria bacterium]|nr:PIG-L family deacetylase [Pseudomonadota bacterium]
MPTFPDTGSSLVFQPSDRILIVAPHPDDESIATGGLIQSALAAGAAVRVIVLTDGDANVWPQRWIEKRWRIDAIARARWGARRREEARQAMRVLGLHEDAARFLGLPDMGLTDLLMRGGTQVCASLRSAIAGFAPTCIVLPALGDRHPDHSAANILVRLALDGGAGHSARLLAYAVHGDGVGANVVCELSPASQDRKRDAILAHATQMRLSSKRFLRHAGPQERYVDAGVPAAPADAAAMPLLRARLGEDGSLHVDIASSQSLRGLALFVVLDDGNDRLCLKVECAPRQREWPVLDTIAGQWRGAAHVQRGEAVWSIRLRTERSRWRQGFVKLARQHPGIWVFDRCGWAIVDPS